MKNKEVNYNSANEKEDSFCFRCTKCGECCKNRDDILLDTFDVCRIAEHLGMKNLDFCEKYTDIFYDEKLKFPFPRLKMREDTGRCPFLSDDNLCSIHAVSPAVCQLYPLGRICSVEEDKPSPVGYFLQDVPCGERDETHTFKSWVRRDIAQFSEEFQLWSYAQTVYSTIIRISERLYDKEEDKFEDMVNACISLLYVEYKSGAPAYDQLQANLKKGEFLYNLITAASNPANPTGQE